VTWTKTENSQQITFIHNGPITGCGVVVIQKIPQVDLVTGKITSIVYSVKASKKYTKFQRFNTLPEAIAAAKKRMEQLN
jgi:hypothetical protein